MIVLGIESSCDETAAAVLADGRRILSSVVASQDAIHAPYGGVVPELASRRHLGHHASEACVQIGLRGDDTGENGRLLREDGGGGFITRGFDGQKIHASAP